MGYSFIGDKPGQPQITCLNVVGVMSGLALSVAVPCKGRSAFAQAELQNCVASFWGLEELSASCKRIQNHP